uniref:Uncharacterized protein n=1 Tax=Fagus sylvatica TaxID=28930 RepID=A0A2N9HEA0_FAGSY
MRQKKAKEMATKVVQNEGKLGLAVHTGSKKQAKNEHQLSKDPKGRGAASSSQLIDASTSTTRPACREYTAVNQSVQWFKEGVKQVFLHGGFKDNVHGKINKEVY